MIEKNNKIIDALHNMYFWSCYISLKDGIYVVLKKADMQKTEMKDTGAYAEIYIKYILSDVCEQDRKKMEKFLDISTLQERIQDKKPIEYEYISRNRGWCRASFIPVDWEDTGKVNSVLLLAASIDAAKKKEEEEKKNHMAFRKMTERIFHIYFTFFGIIDIKDRSIHVVDANATFLSFDKSKNYSYQDIIQGKWTKIILEADQKKFLEKISLSYIQNQLEQNEKYEFTINQYKPENDIGIFVYHLAYLDKEKEKIMCIVEEITDRVDTDEITREISFAGFLRRAEHYLEKKEREYSIVHFDIQGFKAINDQVGFDYGNSILKKVTQIIKKSKMAPVIVSRSMGDHYYCLIERKNINCEEISRLCQLRIPFGKSRETVSMICGIYHVDDRSIHVRSMCDKARLACEQLKRSEITQPYFVFTEKIKEEYLEQKSILSKLDEAIEREEFVAYYQPIYDTKTEKIASAEALVRWITADGKVLSPGVFIPVLEENGQISKIDLFMEQQVRKLLERRKKEGKKIVPISMNLSRNDLHNEEMMRKMIHIANSMKVDLSYLRFEITESAYVEIPEVGEKMIEQLKESGSQILIDDFGSGYSSLGFLAERHFHIVKLDMMFIRRIGVNKRAEAIISSAIDMAHLLEAKVVAEGVETKEQIEFLKREGCDFIQGYYMSKPLSMEEFETLLDRADSSTPSAYLLRDMTYPAIRRRHTAGD